MKTYYCKSCNRETGYKRAFGWGTFFAIILTGFVWILILPFYPKRCIICGNEYGVTTISRDVSYVKSIAIKPRIHSQEEKLAIIALIGAALLVIILFPFIYSLIKGG